MCLFAADGDSDHYSIPVMDETQCVYVHRSRRDRSEFPLKVQTIGSG